MTRTDADVLRFCARFFQEPARLVRATRLRFEHPVALKEHQHDEWLQLDLSLGCVGCWQSGSQERAIAGATATTFYPRERHGFQLQPDGAQGEVLSIKLRVDESWPEMETRLFPSLRQGLVGHGPLANALRRLVQLYGVLQNAPTPAALVALAEVLCLWPHEASRRAPDVHQALGLKSVSEGFAPALREVTEVIETRLADPPTIEELAAQVHFSSRHLARRFREQFGCTPHGYIDSRRLERACELLLQGRLNVTQIAEAVGFASVHSFSRWFHRQTGVAPSQYAVSQLVL